MKVQISQRFIYHKVGTIEIEINKEDYQRYDDLDDYLLENDDLWSEKIDNATSNAELEFGFGLGYYANEYYNVNFNEEASETEIRFDCKELQTGGHL